MKSIATFASASLLAFTSLAEADSKTYVTDPAHSSVTFEIRHFFTPIAGSFNDFETTIVYEEDDVSKNSVTASIKVDSVDTNSEDRDDHLKTDDFFHLAENPELSFESTSWKKTGDDEFEVKGDLSMAGQTNPVTLDVKLLGSHENREGVTVLGWEVTTKLDRRDWGITYGQGIVGNEVTVEIFVETPEAETPEA